MYSEIREKQSKEQQRRKGELTPEKLRTFKGLENVSDEEAEAIIFSVNELSVILYQYCINKKESK